METTNRERAEKYAQLPYTVEVARDETTDGRPVYIARLSEMDGCIGQGETIEQAVDDLKQAAVDYIESLLDDGLPVPQPASFATAMNSATSATITLSNSQPVAGDQDEQDKTTRLFEAALLMS